jgi:tRNA-Thr(GGU) m(6)t(6)A37 methyltransferase TsaA
MTELTLTPIGLIRTPYHDRYAAPSQPGLDSRNAEGRAILNSGSNFEQALEDLDGFDKIWLIYWFDRNPNWKPKVQVPRGPRAKRGVFATRSPHRPNPLGLSLVTLLEVSGRTVRFSGADILDRTPLLDIKPYLPSVEAFPNAKSGWLDDIGELSFEVIWDPEVLLAARQEEELHHVDLIGHAERILAQDPFPHPYKRIKRTTDKSYTLAMKYWRLDYTIEDAIVSITRLRSELPEGISV